jgi:hypothetical protein
MWCQINFRENRWGNQEWTIQNIGNIGHTRNTGRKQTKQNDSTQNNSPKILKWHWTDEWPRCRQTKQKHSTIYVGYHYVQTNTFNVNKTWALIQTTGGKDDPNIVFLCGNRNRLWWFVFVLIKFMFEIEKLESQII